MKTTMPLALSSMLCLTVLAAAEPRADRGAWELEKLDAASLGLTFERKTPKTPSGAWRDLQRKVLSHGRFTPEDGELPSNFGLSSIRGDVNGAHLADYINVRGYGPATDFKPVYVTLVSESWTIPEDGNWHIDQWWFHVGLDGAIGRASHMTLVETMDRTVLDIRQDRLEPGDPRPQTTLDALARFWQDLKPAQAGAAAAGEAPADFCDGVCSAPQRAIWEDFKKGGPIPASDIPEVFSGACYHAARIYDPAQEHHGVAVFDRYKEGYVYGGEFSFFTGSDPYVGLTLEQAKAKGLMSYDDRHLLVLRPDGAEADLHPGAPPVWRYWFRQSASGQELYLLAQWDIYQRVYCRLTRH